MNITTNLIGLFLIVFLIGPLEMMAQHSVSGTVIDSENEEPIPGVNIMIQGTTTGTSTDSDGSYELVAPSPQDTLIFSYIGYQSQTVPIGGRSEVNVILRSEVFAGEELIVVGYGVQEEETITGAVSSVGAEDFENTAATSTADALAGVVQGITTRATNSYLGDSRPGSSSIIQIRNMGEPLFVIDGVPRDAQAFNNLNVNDIENVSILKDASATVYGFRASNGVVLIETKDGNRGGSPQVNVSGYYGWQNFTRYPFDPPANAYLFHRSRAEAEQNRGNPVNTTPEELEKWRQGTEPGYQSYNQYDHVVNNPNAAQYNLDANVSGGSENSTYYFSVGHVNQDYVMNGHNFNRTNIQANVHSDITNQLTIGTEISGRIGNRDNVAIPGREDPIWNALLGANSSWPTDNPYANGNPDFVNGDVRYLTRLPSTYTRDIAGWQEDQTQNFNGNFFAEYEFPFGLVARGTYSYEAGLNTFDRQRYSYDAYCYDEDTDTYNVCDGFNSPLRNKQRTEIKENFAQIRVSYSNDFDVHSLSAMLAYEISDRVQNFHSIESIPPLNENRLIDYVDVNNVGTDWSTAGRAAYVGRATYNYDDRYLLEVLGRYDGSHLYAPDQRWGLFPGISVGWRLTEEAFMEDKLNFIDNLKLRASWGQTGQEQGVDPWDYLGGATYGSTEYMLDGTVVPGVRPRGIPVTNLSWVESTAMNVGIDITMFDDKLDAQFDVFQRKRTGLPTARYDVLLPSEVGYELPPENLESDVQKGIEGIVTYSDQVGEVGFSISANATLARNKVLDPYKPRYENSWDKYRNGIEDRWSGVDFGYQVVGQFQSQEQIEQYTVDNDGQGNTTQLPGDFIYKDANGDGVIDELDQRPIGYALFDNPILGYGFQLRGNYKDFSLSANLQGGTMYSYNQHLEMRYPFQAGHNSQEWMLEDRWRRADLFDPNSEWVPGKYPPNRRNPGHNNYRHSDFWLTNVKYLRLKQLEIGYNLSSLVSGMGVSRLRVYARGTNLYSFDNMKDIQLDPELAQDSGLRYPPQRKITLGFNITF